MSSTATRLCKTCLQSFPETILYWPTRYSKISGKECKACNSKRVAAYQKRKKLEDPEYRNKRNKASYLANKKRYAIDEQFREYCKAATSKFIKQRRIESVEQRVKDSQAGCNWAKKYKYKANARNLLRLSSKLQRTPKWLTQTDLLAIQRIYRLAAILSEKTGIKHQVDHVLPLRGKLVSGLHVPNNLRVVSEQFNKSKSNKYTV